MNVKTSYYIEIYQNGRLSHTSQPFTSLEEAVQVYTDNKLTGRIMRRIERVEIITEVVWPEGIC